MRSIALPCIYSKYFVMASKEEFTTGVAFALSCVKQEYLVLRQKQLEVLQNIYEGRDVFVWFPTGYRKSVCYQLLPYNVKFSGASIQSREPRGHCTYIYSTFFVRILIYAFTVCYTVRYLTHAHKYMYSKYQASLLSLEA